MILHPQLQQDCFILGSFELSALLLLNDSQYPWFILVPQRQDIAEIHTLSTTDQQQLIHESSLLAQAISQQFHADKMNIATLGNIVPQLHMHHIARFTTDKAWPKPVWGAFPSIAYTENELAHIKQLMYTALPNLKPVQA